ncbi:MAG TPA: phosphate acyltransferase PlsX [Candidatus Glassbacteria bacterium]|nr:phosphate acyltransferase PlsX [Candidatus Glassbacteria bacterium]
MRIALDVMGGDHTPAVPIKGAVDALEELESDFELLLVGDEERIRGHLERHSDRDLSRLQIVHAPEVVEMGESPTVALRKKKLSSIAIGVELNARQQADAFISAGNTGAVMAASLRGLGRIGGISRPGICSVFPTTRSSCVVVDVGANVDSKPIHLLHFALMGSIYSEKVLGTKKPRVGLLNVGEEPSKGDELTVATHKLLAKSALNFIGNVEGRDIFDGAADVVVCDGFVGNVILKLSERVLSLLVTHLKNQVKASPMAALGFVLLKKTFEDMKQTFDYAEYGGAPLLGIDGITIICHGGSPPRAFRNAIKCARLAVLNNINQKISEEVKNYQTECLNNEQLS